MRVGGLIVLFILGVALSFSSLAAESEDEDGGVTLDLDALKAPEAREEEPPSQAPSIEAVEVPQPAKTRVTFARGVPEVKEEDRVLLADFANAVKDTTARLTIVSYASAGDGLSENAARRLALRRAINLRQILVAEGIEGTRINLQPKGPAELGDDDQAGPGDWAEVIVEGG